MADVLGRLDELWAAAAVMEARMPALAASYRLQMMHVASHRGVAIFEGFYERVCSGCGVLFEPFANCSAAVWEHLRARRFAGERRAEGRDVVLSSRLCGRRRGGRRETAVYTCGVCGLITVFDSLSTVAPQPARKAEEGQSAGPARPVDRLEDFQALMAASRTFWR